MSDIAEPRERGETFRGHGALTVLHDPGCELCARCRAWLEVQPQLVPLRFVAADDPIVDPLRDDLPWIGDELVVVGDDGAVWIGAAAFLVCLWATETFRPWSYRLSGPAFAPLATRFLEQVSTNRGRISGRLRRRAPVVGIGVGVGRRCGTAGR